MNIELKQQLAALNPTRFWLTSISPWLERSVKEIVEEVIAQENVYAFATKSRGIHAPPGDWICFYATKIGVVAHAKVKNAPRRSSHPAINSTQFPWIVELAETQTYTTRPVLFDSQKRAELDALKNRDPNKPWSWLVQQTRTITQHDFMLLTQAFESKQTIPAFDQALTDDTKDISRKGRTPRK